MFAYVYLTHISDFLLWYLRLCKRTRKKEEKGQLTNCPSSIRNMPQQRLIDKVTHARAPCVPIHITQSCYNNLSFLFLHNQSENHNYKFYLSRQKKLEIGRSNCGSHRHNNASFPKKHHVANVQSFHNDVIIREDGCKEEKHQANQICCKSLDVCADYRRLRITSPRTLTCSHLQSHRGM